MLGLLGEWGGSTQEAYLGQLRTMGSLFKYLFCALMCATGVFYSYAHIQTEEYKPKHLPYISTAEDSNEKQLVSFTWWSQKLINRSLRGRSGGCWWNNWFNKFCLDRLQKLLFISVLLYYFNINQNDFLTILLFAFPDQWFTWSFGETSE